MSTAASTLHPDESHDITGDYASPITLMPVELLERVFSGCATLDLVRCQWVCWQWRYIINRSTELRTMLFMNADQIVRVMKIRGAFGDWEIREKHAARQPEPSKRSFAFFGFNGRLEWIVCDVHPLLSVKGPADGFHPVTDICFTTDSMDYDTLQLCANAYLSQPPCFMCEIYVRESGSSSQYLAPDDKRFATLGMLCAAVERYRDKLNGDPGVRAGPALDMSKSLYIDGYIYREGRAVQMAYGNLAPIGLLGPDATSFASSYGAGNGEISSLHGRTSAHEARLKSWNTLTRSL